MKQDVVTRHDFESQAMPLLPNLLRAASCLLAVESDAQELVRISVARAYRLWRKNETAINYRVWLFRIMATAFANWRAGGRGCAVTSAGVTEVTQQSTPSGSGWQAAVRDSAPVPLATISVDDVEKAMRDLPDHLRLPVVLSLVEGCSYRDIGDVAGISVEMVRTRLREGRTMMRRSLVDGMTVAGMSGGSQEGIREELRGRT